MAAPRVVVGLDFGTTFSGFAYAHQSDLEDIHTFYEWPMQVKAGAKPYCKTQTSLFYGYNCKENCKEKKGLLAPKLSFVSKPSEPELELVLKDWAWPAQVHYLQGVQTASFKRAASVSVQDVQHEVGYFVKQFKLHLASESEYDKEKEKEQHNDNGKGKGKGKAKANWLEKKFIVPFLKFCSSSKKGAQHNENYEKAQHAYASSSKEAQHNETNTKTVEETDTAAAEYALMKGTMKVEYSGNVNDVYRELPPGVTVERAITDYLRSIASFIVAHLRSTYGKHLSGSDVQWCLTVPAIWDDKAKQQMSYCAQKAGLAKGPSCPSEMANAASPFPLIIVLESEAASVYCTTKSKQLSLQVGAQFLVADVGGGTTDIVVHMKQSNDKDTTMKIRQVKQSVGGLCGGTFVDTNFIHFLCRKVRCFPDFVKENGPLAIASILRKWEDLKCSFDGTLNSGVEFELPVKLAKAWEKHEVMEAAGQTTRESYDEIEITNQDFRDIFDPVVDQILSLIQGEMSPSIKVLMMVGGFSASPYLMKRVHQAFSMQVKEIVCPPDPGSAICQGAVVLGVSPDIIMTRISRRTYGISQYRNFEDHKDPANWLQVVEGVRKCMNTFQVYIKRGEEVSINQCVEKIQSPLYSQQKSLTMSVYSTLDPNPQYITDPGVKLEGTFVINIPEEANTLDKHRSISVSLYFGRSCIQVKAKRLNFGNRNKVFVGLDNVEFVHGPCIT